MTNLSKTAIPNINERRDAITAAIVHEMTDRGWDLTKKEEGQLLPPLAQLAFIDGVQTQFQINTQSEDYSYKQGNRLRIRYAKIGREGRSHWDDGTRQRPEPNKGFNVQVICADLEAYVEAYKERSKVDWAKSASQQASRELVQAIGRDLGIAEENTLVPTLKLQRGITISRSDTAHLVRTQIDLELDPTSSTELACFAAEVSYEAKERALFAVKLAERKLGR